MEPEVLEHILHGRKKPTNLQLSLLRNITGNFSEELVIGKGGFATVYKGVLPNRNVVAVKRIMNRHTIDDTLFYREVDSLLAVNHQNIVQFLGYCASTDQTAVPQEGSKAHVYAELRERLLCFEYISNGSLQEHITAADELRGLEWNERYVIIKGICKGLDYLLNEKRIYHMDLKPLNILLDSSMVPKITDFGQSRYDEKSQTISMNRWGTRGYCPPEYALFGKMSPKSDMYSLGTIIIELVTGKKEIPNNNNKIWKKTGKETLLAYQQVTTCIDIGLLCQEIDPNNRPPIGKVMRGINEMDRTDGQTTNAYESFSLISPYPEDDMLGIEPLELHFPFELNKQISCSLKLTNKTDAYIAFNVQTMGNLPYCTEPNKDIVPPRSKCSVNITLEAQDKAPWDMQRENEFIVWSAKVNDGFAAKDITTGMFSEETGVVDAVNLDVVFYAGERCVVDKGQGSSDEDFEDREYDVAALAHNLSQAFRYGHKGHVNRMMSLSCFFLRYQDVYFEDVSSLREEEISKTQENKTSANLPGEIPYEFFKRITNGFSDEQKISGTPFETLYKGINPDDDKVIIVKKLHKDALKVSLMSSIQEAWKVMALKHENIVQLVGYCSETNKKLVKYDKTYIQQTLLKLCSAMNIYQMGAFTRIFLVRSKVSAWDSSSAKHGIDWDTRFKIINGICRGIHFLNKLDIPIIHMDLNPRNIWLDESFVPKIGNFDFSTCFGQEQPETLIEDLTPYAYMAPEFLYRGVFLEKSNIYSLGLIIMGITTREKNSPENELLSGRRYIDRIRQEWIPEHIVSIYNTLGADSLQQVKMCIDLSLECMETDPARRPSIDSIVDKLNEIRSRWSSEAYAPIYDTAGASLPAKIKEGPDLPGFRKRNSGSWTIYILGPSKMEA
ncbi:hypothetical protein ACQ4PT_045541 [Festuca glaucescens]